jgi:hypothetical protein
MEHAFANLAGLVEYAIKRHVLLIATTKVTVLMENANVSLAKVAMLVRSMSVPISVLLTDSALT